MKINTRVVRYVLIIFSVIIATYAIQVFVQNFNIEKEIKDLKQTQYLLSGETYWTKNYYEPYLKTEYAKMIFKHRAWIVWENEKLYKIVSYNETKTIDKQERKIYNKPVARKSCIDFFKDLKEKYFTN